MFFFLCLLLVFGVVFCTLAPLSRPITLTETSAKKLRVQRQWVSLALLFIIPGLSFSVYRFLGNPNLEDQPYSVRAALNSSNISRFIGSVEKHLAEHGDDARGWLVLAEMQQSENQSLKAIEAYRNAEKLQPSETAQLGLAINLLSNASPQNLNEAALLLQKIKQNAGNQTQIKIQAARLKMLQGAQVQGARDLRQLYDALPDNNPQRYQILELLQKQNATETNGQT